MAKVAFIGLGVMGYPMAGHLKRKGGHDVTVYNRTASKAANWAAEYGGFAAATPAGAADDADFVFTCVGNDDDLREVTIGPEGCIKAMKSGAILIDNTTASADVARELEIPLADKPFYDNREELERAALASTVDSPDNAPPLPGLWHWLWGQ